MFSETAWRRRWWRAGKASIWRPSPSLPRLVSVNRRSSAAQHAFSKCATYFHYNRIMEGKKTCPANDVSCFAEQLLHRWERRQLTAPPQAREDDNAACLPCLLQDLEWDI